MHNCFQNENTCYLLFPQIILMLILYPDKRRMIQVELNIKHASLPLSYKVIVIVDTKIEDNVVKYIQFIMSIEWK